MIHLLSVPCIAMASINFYVGLYYLLLYLKQTRFKEHLPFALLCFSVGFYDIFAAGLYGSLSIDTGVFYQKLQLNTLFPIIIFMIWMACIFVEKKITKIVKIFIAGFILLFLINTILLPIIAPELLLSASKPDIKHINIFNLLKITYYEGETGIVYTINLILSILAYLYFLFLLTKLFLKNKDKLVLILIVSMVVYFCGVINDILIMLRVYQFIYVSEYSFMFIIVSMSYLLLNQFANLQVAYEKLNQNLEKIVTERTKELSIANQSIQEEMNQKELFNEALRKSNLELEQYARMVSHDLQEPLRKIKTFGKRLIDKYDSILDEKGFDYLGRIFNAANRMQTLIDDLMTYSRVSNKAEPYSIADLSQIVQEVLSDLEIRIEKTAGKVEAGPLPSIYADPTQMRQLFQNLIGNALKFYKPGTPPLVKVYEIKKVPPEFIGIIVEDNGIGIDKKYYDQIFDVFQRLHGKDEYEGSGIGLSVCKKIVERHGGNIKVESKPGEGTKFIIQLPVK